MKRGGRLAASRAPAGPPVPPGAASIAVRGPITSPALRAANARPFPRDEAEASQ
jgi:hypothetical protein